MNTVEIIKEDYQRFPENQTYSIYAEDVYFKDPLNEFTGKEKYKKMIQFLGKFFQNIKMEVHSVRTEECTIVTEWTLNMTSPLPWKPRLSIPGWSELTTNPEGIITAHVDRWKISPWDVLKQNFAFS